MLFFLFNIRKPLSKEYQLNNNSLHWKLSAQYGKLLNVKTNKFMIDNETTFHKWLNDTDINSYWTSYYDNEQSEYSIGSYKMPRNDKNRKTIKTRN